MSTPFESSSRVVLDQFSEAVRSWFLDTFEAPTPLQERAWDVIEGGESALVIAPTGSGKTLAAFLFAIDALMREKAASKATHPAQGVRVLYISPLKALGADVERNLQEPLAGIAERLDARGAGALQVRTGMRTGDTTPDQRRSLVRKPPDILITTPESLYLMLTSKARDILRTVETVIVDEVHALAGSKRGAHMALSLERLDDLLEQPAQRLGLSATVRPRDEIARFLGGLHPVRVVADTGRPAMDVQVVVPVADMTAIPAFQGFDAPVADMRDGSSSHRLGHGGALRRAPQKEAWKSDRALRAAMNKPSGFTPDSRMGTSSIWPHIEAAILDQVLTHHTTIVFVNSRGLCEKLTARINELYAKRQGMLLGSVADGSSVPSHTRSDLGSTTEMGQGAPDVIAKAHHGSVSKEKRLQVEHELKSGRLPCVVATSSLELGIDMGSIDLVLQVAAPPSVASALQRIGRANHQVGGRSVGVIYPRTRTEIIDAAVVAEGMREGHIEKTALVRNPLDVLSQQTVAAIAMDNLSADDWYATVRRSASFSELPRRAFDSVLDMLAGRNNTADLSEFSPRIVFDRETGMLTARPGSQRHAVMSAGTIPDRGMFSVVLPEGRGNEGRRRVGELDEEMVYESRVGDIIALGTSSWRISEITRDRVIVEPAPGRSARLPFWHGEGAGKPAETGRARGEFLRAVAAGIGDVDEADDVRTFVDAAVKVRLEEDGLDVDAQDNLIELIRVQRAATGVVPDDKTLVVERCEDEEGDWRVLLHSPYGRRVHEPWAMAVSDRITRVYGYDPQAMAADEGIMLRVPLSENRLPGAELFIFDTHELECIVRDRVNSTSLFAARFRECAARALLMSPLAPGKRSPLWHQRLRAGQLLEAARREREFPILAETARECLQDVYDMDALRELMEAVQAGSVRIAEAQTSVPSPFAAPLLFGYVGEHLYLGDMPHAEQRASLLSLDTALLGELLGTADMAQLLDEQVVYEVEGDLQRVAADHRVRGVEGVADLLRILGPLSEEEVSCRLQSMGTGQSEDVDEGVDATEAAFFAAGFDDQALVGQEVDEWASVSEARALLEKLQHARRAFSVLIGGAERWVSSEDGGLLHEALGISVPPDVPAMFLESSDCVDGQFPLDSLIARYARTRGPFATEEVAVRWGIGPAPARESLLRLVGTGKLIQGTFGKSEGAGERTWVSADVFQRLRLRSLAKARRAVQPVRQDAFVRFLLDLQGMGSGGEARFEGIEGVAQVIAQFEGVFLSAEAWESSVFPGRVRDYRPSMLDELIASGDVVWAGRKTSSNEEPVSKSRGGRVPSKGAEVGRVAFYPTDSPFAPQQPCWSDSQGEEFALKSGDDLLNDAQGAPSPHNVCSRVEAAVVETLGRGGLFFRQIVDAVRRRLAPDRIEEGAIATALQELVWTTQATNDTFAPIRAMGEGSVDRRPRPAPRRRVSSRHSRPRSVALEGLRETASSSAVSGISGAVLSGRWSLLVPSGQNDTVRALALVESILDRYGVLTRDIVLLSGVPGGMGTLFPVLRSMEDAGEVLRGSFVKGLGPAQFAARETIDVLRTYEAVDDGKGDCLSGVQAVVLAADDPASLFGAGIPWPSLAEDERLDNEVGNGKTAALRPARRGGSMVVIRAGAVVLYATAGLRSILAFTSDDHELADAVQALVAQAVRTVRRGGSEAARKKMSVETFNGHPVLATPFADILQAAGFVRLPDGMRLYSTPF